MYWVLPRKSIVGGHGLGRVYDHINHFGYHIKEIWILKAWAAAMLKGPGENTDVYSRLLQLDFEL